MQFNIDIDMSMIMDIWMWPFKCEIFSALSPF